MNVIPLPCFQLQPFFHNSLSLSLPPPLHPLCSPLPPLRCLQAIRWSPGWWNSTYIPLNTSAPFAVYDGPNVFAIASSVYRGGAEMWFDMQMVAEYK